LKIFPRVSVYFTKNKLKIDDLKQQIVALEVQSQDSNLWDDPQKAQSIMQDLSQNRDIINQFENNKSGI
jgi:hypothetical protein